MNSISVSDNSYKTLCPRHDYSVPFSLCKLKDGMVLDETFKVIYKRNSADKFLVYYSTNGCYPIPY